MKTKTDVQYLMRQRGVTQESIANGLGICRIAVNRVFNGHDRTPRVREAIAEALGVPQGRLARALGWPDAPGRRPTPAAEKEAVA